MNWHAGGVQAKDLSMPLKMELTQKMGTQHAHDIRAVRTTSSCDMHS
jgi:hypothetical protein